MSVQTTYNFATPRGVAGGLYDLSNYCIDTRINAQAGGNVCFGMGLIRGDKPGSNVKLPVAESTAADFEGIAMNGFNTQQTIEGDVRIASKCSVGILRSGRAWVRIQNGIAPKYGEALYLIKTGDDAGCFTNVSADGLAVNGIFIGEKGSGNVAPAELFHQK